MLAQSIMSIGSYFSVEFHAVVWSHTPGILPPVSNILQYAPSVDCAES